MSGFLAARVGSGEHSAAADAGQAAATAAAAVDVEAAGDVKSQPGPPQPAGAEAQSQSQALSRTAAGDDMVVVTLLLKTSGRRVLPRRDKGGGGVRGLASAEEVREALLELGRLRQEEVLCLEVTWVPRAPGESLSWRQLQLSYQNLLPL
ncbi:hypothetical protein GPECTOR_35g859 [Gonium pectorale]|uniref:Uncharacterized protein n=1 Tax=Gonium pectorale TaxID=33097 RepID=A0A150GC39_GONPE|nr:hypothetical protein GPECTOR_35g859 [Gonium pectorale]|eukprot:KXZ47421.1 hypothetical protein GPECTOR_35g859 [Gonium pectorale]